MQRLVDEIEREKERIAILSKRFEGSADLEKPRNWWEIE